MLDRQTGRSRGFGFVHFDTQEDLQAAIDSMHDTEADGRKISVTRAVPQNETAPGVPARVLSSRDRHCSLCSSYLMTGSNIAK